MRRDLLRSPHEPVRALAGLAYQVYEGYTVRGGRRHAVRHSDSNTVQTILGALDMVLARPDDVTIRDAAHRSMQQYLRGQA